MKNSKTVILKRGRGRLREVVKRFLERHREKKLLKQQPKKLFRLLLVVVFVRVQL